MRVPSPSVFQLSVVSRAGSSVRTGAGMAEHIDLRAMWPALVANAMCGEAGEPSSTRRHVHVARSGLSQSVHIAGEMYERVILAVLLNCSYVRSLHLCSPI